MHILLAEDNPINQKLAIIILQKAGYKVDAVENGQVAFEKIQQENYDAVLMDVQMPELDGFESTHLIREWEHDRGRHIPIIAMTAHALKGDRELCLDAGMDDYVSKPLDSKLLFAALDRWTQSEEKLPPQKINETELEDYSNPVENPGNPLDLDFEEGLFGEQELISPVRTAENGVDSPENPQDEIPLDLDAALCRFMIDRAFFDEMCHDFMVSLPNRIQEIKVDLQEKNVIDLYRHAHNLKGISANFNAVPVSRLAAQLEALGRSEDISVAACLVEKLEIEAERLSTYCITELGVS